MVKKIVVKIGGSLILKEDNINSEKIREFCDILKEIENFSTIIVVCGGGIIARKYINVVRAFNGNEVLCDLFGIDVSRLNSRLIIAGLGEHAYPIVPKTFEEISSAQLSQKTIVMGGLQPGQSTTSVAIEVAEFIEADEIIILTDVDGIYDKDPNKYNDAKLFNQISYSKLQEIIIDPKSENQAAAGEYRIFDTVSLQLLRRSKIKALIMSGQNLNHFREYIQGNTDVRCTRIIS